MQNYSVGDRRGSQRVPFRPGYGDSNTSFYILLQYFVYACPATSNYYRHVLLQMLPLSLFISFYNKFD